MRKISTIKLIKTLENFKMPPKKKMSMTPSNNSTSASQASNNELLAAINASNEQTSILREEVGAMNRLLTEALNKIAILENEKDNMNIKLQEQDNRISILENQLKNTQQFDEERITRIENQQERSEQVARSNKIIIKGPAISYEADDLRTEVITKLSTILRIPQETLNNAEYRKFGKMGKCILMSAHDNNNKLSLFEAVRAIKPANLSINEFLTPAKAKLIYELRKLKYEEGKFHSVFSINGKVYVTHKQGGPETLINHISDIR
jgi:hypothetical protein